jgi:zinc transport system substrate-binding protein
MISCNQGNNKVKRDVITVSVAPFSYFAKAIGGDMFDINIMVPASADPHIYEPVPGQISELSRSVAYISDGYLGFEMTWLDRFYEANRKMKKLQLGSSVDLILSNDHHEGEHTEGADPHFWVSPLEAMKIAESVKNFLTELDPSAKDKFEAGYKVLTDTISAVNALATRLFSDFRGATFMIYHPALGYLARDYGLNQIAVENEGKEPTPSSMKNLIDLAGEKKIRMILIQKGFDTKNAGAIASETGSVLVPVDPLSEDWPRSVREIINAVHKSLITSSK